MRKLWNIIIICMIPLGIISCSPSNNKSDLDVASKWIQGSKYQGSDKPTLEQKPLEFRARLRSDISIYRDLNDGIDGDINFSIIGSKFYAFRESHPGNYSRFLYFDGDGENKKYLGAIYIDKNSGNGYFEDRNGEFIDKQGSKILSPSKDKDLSDKYKSHNVDNTNAVEFLLDRLLHLKAITSTKEVTGSISNGPYFEKYQNESHSSYISIELKNKDRELGQFLVRKDGMVIYKFNGSIKEYETIYGNHIRPANYDTKPSIVASTKPEDKIDYSKEDLIEKCALAIIYGDDNSMTDFTTRLKKPVQSYSYIAAPPKNNRNRAILISPNDGTTIKLFKVIGKDPTTNQYKKGDIIFNVKINRGESIVLDYVDNEKTPYQVCEITARDGKTSVIYDFTNNGYDTHRNGAIAQRLIQYGAVDNKSQVVSESIASICKFLYTKAIDK